MSIAKDLAALFRRDLSRLMQQIEAFPDDETLWQTVPGVSNSAGNLALHLEGNLREYIGRQLGHVPYSRERPLEFSSNGIRKEEISIRLAELRRVIPPIIEGLSSQQMEMEYPEVVLDTAMSTQQFLMHLYGHLNWHLGQIYYLRCAIAAD
jgi:uncharacterized damage-inducible protein DinB